MTAAVDQLGALRKRAIASSSDRDSWLAARTGGVTATEVAKLAKGGAGAKREILASKISGDPFRGNQYTEWGKLREAAIAEDVRARTAIEPNDVLFHAEGSKRHLATPDGVGANFGDEIVLSEIKTSKHDLDPGWVGLDNVVKRPEQLTAGKVQNTYFWSTGYYDQVQWQIYVCGAVSARFTWEQHNDDWSGWDAETRTFAYGPTPLEQTLPFVTILRDDIRIDELVAIADDFLADYDVALRDAADGVAPEIDDQLDTLAVNLLRFRELEADGKRSKESTWKQMLERLEGCDPLSQESTLARVTYNPGEETTTEVPDVESAKLADPQLFIRAAKVAKEWNEHLAKFTKPSTTPAKPSLTVTAIKQKTTKETKK